MSQKVNTVIFNDFFVFSTGTKLGSKTQKKFKKVRSEDRIVQNKELRLISCLRQFGVLKITI